MEVMADGRSPFDGGQFHYVKLGTGPGQNPEPESVPPPWQSAQEAEGKEPQLDTRRRGRVLDRVIGIVLGLVLGIGIVTAYVFLGSEETIDAPRVQTEGRQQTQGTQQQPQEAQQPPQSRQQQRGAEGR